MNKLSIALLVSVLLLGGVHLAAADETSSDCEKNVTWYDAQGNKHNDTQPWPGYTDTDPVRSLFYQADAAAGDPVLFNMCEGEQWDGQDQVQNSYHPTDDPCSATPSPDTTHPAVDDCMGNDPNNGTGQVPTPAGDAGLRLRVTGDQEGASRQQYYVAVHIGAVGWAVVYLGECNGGAGLETDRSCGGSHDMRQGVYLRDDTPGNALAQVVSSVGLTKGYVSEGDCSESTYMSGAEQGNRHICGRDNTAVGAEEIIP
jgi:hypothetical protein